MKIIIDDERYYEVMEAFLAGEPLPPPPPPPPPIPPPPQPAD